MWNFKAFSGNTAIIDEGGKNYSYSWLDGECGKLAENVKSGRCLVFNLCSNEPGSLIGYAAFIDHSIVPVMLDAHMDRGLLASLIDTYQPDYLWLPSGMAEEFPSCAERYSSVGYSLLKTPFTKVFPLYEELGLLLTTSGSTGSPKFVRQSYANIRANTESIVRYLELDSTERPITTLPMSYTYGLSIVNTHLYVGASIILTQKALMQKEFWQLLKNHGATSFGGVPYTYEMLEKLRFFRMDLPTLRTMTQAGGKLSPELHKKFAEYALDKGKHFVVMYGQAEATARMSYLPHEKSLEKYGSMGIAIPGGEFSLIDVDGKEIMAPDVVGELVYKGKNVTLGYAESGKDLIKGDERGGVLLTGDMARRDEDGYYYIVGRKKRFLKLYGSRVNLVEVEELLKKKNYEAACVGEDDHMRIYTTSEDTAGLHSYIASIMGINRAAFEVFHIAAIPRNEAGKVLYSNLEVQK